MPDGIASYRGALNCDPANSAQVLDRAVLSGARQLWVGPAMAARLGWPAAFAVPPARRADKYRFGLSHAWLGPALAAGWETSTEPSGLAPWLGLTRGQDWVDLVVPGWDADNPFAEAAGAGQLLRALALYSQALGLRYRRSPGVTGLALMRATHAGPGGVQLPPGDPPPPALAGLDSDAPAQWLAERAPGRGWLHCWDLNGMYLAACSSAELGFGHPTKALAGSFSNRPGYWRAAIRSARPGPRACPLPFLADGRPHWYTTPALIFMAEAGARVKVAEVWSYPESHRWLEPWYARLRDGRAGLMGSDDPAAGLALGALKRTYTQALGRLAGRWLPVGDETFRPDWRDTITARARANLHRHLAKAVRPPIALYADAAVWASPHEGPQEAAAELGLEVGPQLGKWKHAGALRASEAAQVVKDAGSRPRALRALLDALGRPL